MMGISSVPKYVIRIRHIGKCQNTQIKSLAYKVRAIITEKAKRKNLKLPHPNPDKAINLKMNRYRERLVEISVPLRT